MLSNTPVFRWRRLWRFISWKLPGVMKRRYQNKLCVNTLQASRNFRTLFLQLLPTSKTRIFTILHYVSCLGAFRASERQHTLRAFRATELARLQPAAKDPSNRSIVCDVPRLSKALLRRQILPVTLLRRRSLLAALLRRRSLPPALLGQKNMRATAKPLHAP